MMTSLTASNDFNTLAREVIGDIAVELARLPNGALALSVRYAGEYLTGWQENMSDFQAGRLFEHEVGAYRRILK